MKSSTRPEQRDERPPQASSRRAVVATGLKLAYSAPLVATSLRLTGDEGLAAGCNCPTGSIPIPDSVIADLRKAGLNSLADHLSDKCVGCKTGAIVPPSPSSVAERVQEHRQGCPERLPRQEQLHRAEGEDLCLRLAESVLRPGTGAGRRGNGVAAAGAARRTATRIGVDLAATPEEE